MLDLKTKLYRHQVDAVNKLIHVKVGALYMEQGTGKTRTALELIKRRLDAGKVDAVLWLCPCSVKKNLREDIIYHVGNFPDNLIIKGIESLSSADALYLKLLEMVQAMNVYIIVDESILIKNKFAIRSNRIIELGRHCKYKLILNGTPVSRNEADLFAQWYFLDWRILGYESYYSFAANHLEYKEVKLPDGRRVVDYNRVVGILNIGYLTEKIAPYMYQVRKSECLDIPPKKYYIKPFILSSDQYEEYYIVKQIYLENVDEFKPETIYKLFSACQHVTSGRRVLTGPTKRMKTENMFPVLENPRIKVLKDILTNFGDEKAIIFAKYQQEIDEIMELLRSLNKTGVMFTGEVSQKKRQENRKRFSEDVQFLVANKVCGAFGLNLQFCHNVVFYNNDFDLATRMQAEDRVHRIGQEHEVHIIDICAVGCIDEFILNCLDRKESMVGKFKAEIDKWRDTKMNRNIEFKYLSAKDDSAKFWPLMGPVFASRAIRKEFDGYPLSNSDNWPWLVALKDDELIGFMGLEPLKNGIKISAMWVHSEYRRQGICSELIMRATNLADADKKYLSITARAFMQEELEKYGFQITSKRSEKWINLRRDKVEKNIQGRNSL